jgi:hypothetical protein
VFGRVGTYVIFGSASSHAAAPRPHEGIQSKNEHRRSITDMERAAFVNMLEQYDRLGRTERGEML